VIVPGSGVDIDRFSPETCSCSAEKADEIVVLPARMLYDKGITTFVECAQYLRDRSLAVRFVLVGPADPGNPAAVPLSQLRAWNRTGVVEWWGPVADIRTAFRRAAVVVLPSKREGMPKIVIEAAACGIPVVTTDVPGCRDSVMDGKTGFLVPEGDVRALANRVEVLLHDAALRKRMGALAREFAAEKFAAPLVVRQIFEEASAMI
jgi:glycosyltransferase involved in cell wall biosynthesis